MRGWRLFFLILCCVPLLAAFFAGPGTAFAAQPFAADTAASPLAAPHATEAEGYWHFLAAPLVHAMEMQQAYYRKMAGALRVLVNEHSLAAAWALVSLSFAYGIFHAVGPGHGKIVVTSYLLADEREVRRGVLIAFLSSFMQAVTAVVAVGLLAVALGLTRRSVAGAIPLIERASFVLVIGVGAWLLRRTLKGGHRHAHHPHHTHEGHGDGHGHRHDHHDDHHGHVHLPTPQEIGARPGWRGMAAMILAVGLRPCTGAVLVLLFALAQETFFIGVLSAFAMSVGTAITVSTLAVLTVFSKNMALGIASRTDNPWTLRIERGLEIGGGLFILLMGLFLLAGSLVAPAQPLF